MFHLPRPKATPFRPFALWAALLTAALIAAFPAASRSQADPVRYANSTTYADSVITFNEVMYNPAPNDTAGEWIELRNQLAVMVDLSNWRLEGVEYKFPPGTRLPGGAYLVIAADPVAFQARTGVTAFGPFIGRLNDAGEQIVLRNHNGRLMDEVRYEDTFPWPVAPDGSGASLAKRVADSPSSPAENWAPSALAGGTPGTENFPPPQPTPLPVTDTFITTRSPGRWKIPTAADASTQWQNPSSKDDTWNSGTNRYGFDTSGISSLPKVYQLYHFDGNTSDSSGNGFLATFQDNPQYVADPAPVSGSNSSLQFDGINDAVEISDIGIKPAYTLSAWVKFNAVRPGSLIVLTDSAGPGGSWSHQLRVTPSGNFEHYTFDGDWNLVTGTTQIQPTVWYHVVATAVNNGMARLFVNGLEEGTPEPVGQMWTGGTRWLLGTASSGFPNAFAGRMDEVAFWESALTPTEIASLAKGASPAGTTGFQDLIQTDFSHDMKGVNSSAWIRHTFAAPSPVGYSSMSLRVRYNDGFVAWLNGKEVARRNAPNTLDWNSASAGIRSSQDTLLVETIDLSSATTSLTPGGNVLAIQLLNATPNDPNAFLELELTAQRQVLNISSSPLLLFSEVQAANSPNFWCELFNTSEIPLDLTHYRIRSSSGSEYVFRQAPLGRGEYLALGTNLLGFTVESGDRLFLLGADGFQILDAVRVSNKLQARKEFYPLAPFLHPSAPTRSAPNTFDLHGEIVINEVLYHAPPTYAQTAANGQPAIPYANNPEQWIELYNRSTQTIDLGGWSLNADIHFQFPANTLLGPDEYLVITGNRTQLALQYPGIRILGDWNGKLSSRNGRIQLRDSADNPADELHYFDDAPWPSRADGGGSSLELRNPVSNHSLPESWAASDESSRTSWKKYSYRAKAIAPTKAPAINGFHEFRMGLLADGEAWIDDLKVVEDPDGTARSLIQNSSFNDTKAWRLLGNHSHSSIGQDPADAANSALHLVATDARGYMHNQLESTLKVGATIVPVVTGRTYEISFLARWIGGSPQLHTELYYNKVAKTTILDIPTQHGTPGRRNSTYIVNPGPDFDSLSHSPLIPKPGETVSIQVRARDADGIAELKLHWSTAGTAWQERTMTTKGDGLYFGTITSPANLSVVQFYVEGRDTLGAIALYPAGGTNSRALFRSDSRSAKLPRKGLAFMLTPSDTRLMDVTTNMMSDDRIGTTVIWDNSEVFYNCGVHLHGSMFTRQNLDAVPYNIQFPADHKFRGVHRTIQPNRGVIEEIIAKHTQNQAGIPGMYEDIVELQPYRNSNSGAARLSLAHYNDIFLGSQFENGADGMLFNMEGIRVAQATHNGTPEGIKLGMPVDWVGDYDIMNLGDDPEQYRFSTTLRNNRSRSDFSRYIAMAKAFSLAGPAFEQAAPAVMDVDEWMRYYALLTLFEVGDTYTLGNPHNIGFYARPSDGKVIALPYDWDFFFANGDTSPIWGNQNLNKLITRPANTRLLYGHLLDLIDGAFNTTTLNPFITNFGTIAGQSFTGYSSRIRARSTFIRGRLPAKIAFEITSNGGVDFSTETPEVTLEGRGWVDVRDVRWANYGPVKLTWLDGNRWRTTLPLSATTNSIQLEAFNQRGEPVGSDSITISTIQPGDSQRRFLRISEIQYHPANPSLTELAAGYSDSEAFEFVEVSNYGPVAVSLDGVRFTLGIQFDFTTSNLRELAPGKSVIVARNLAAFSQRYPKASTPAGVYGDGLSNSGETLRLIDRFGTLIHEVTYGDEDPWPSAADGDGYSLELTSADGPTNTAAGWHLGIYGGSPGEPPALALPTDISNTQWVDGKLRITFMARRNQSYRLLGSATLDGNAWLDLQAIPSEPADHEVTLELTPASDQNFYRLASP